MSGKLIEAVFHRTTLQIPISRMMEKTSQNTHNNIYISSLLKWRGEDRKNAQRVCRKCSRDCYGRIACVVFVCVCVSNGESRLEGRMSFIVTIYLDSMRFRVDMPLTFICFQPFNRRIDPFTFLRLALNLLPQQQQQPQHREIVVAIAIA